MSPERTPTINEQAAAYVDDLHDKGYEATEIISMAKNHHKVRPEEMTQEYLDQVLTICNKWIAESEGRRA